MDNRIFYPDGKWRQWLPVQRLYYWLVVPKAGDLHKIPNWHQKECVQFKRSSCQIENHPRFRFEPVLLSPNGCHVCHQASYKACICDPLTVVPSLKDLAALKVAQKLYISNSHQCFRIDGEENILSSSVEWKVADLVKTLNLPPTVPKTIYKVPFKNFNAFIYSCPHCREQIWKHILYLLGTYLRVSVDNNIYVLKFVLDWMPRWGGLARETVHFNYADIRNQFNYALFNKPLKPLRLLQSINKTPTTPGTLSSVQRNVWK